MKTKIIFAITVLCAVFLWLTTSCNEDEMITYEGKDQVYYYFASRTYPADRVDSVIIALGYDNPLKADSTLQIRAMIMGATTDYDRPIHFVLVDSLSTAKLGEDIEPLYDQSFISANSIYGWVRFKVKNTAKLSDSTLIAAIRTMPNDYFYADYVQIRSETSPGRKLANTYYVYFDARNEMPNLWSARLSSFTTYFGVYSRVKLEFMCEVLGLTRDYFMYDPATENVTDVYNARIGNYIIAWIMTVNRRLNQYEAEHGVRLKDEYGNEVKMGLSSIY